MRKWLFSAIVVGLIASTLAVASTNAQGPQDGLERAIAAQESNTPSLMARSGVVGTAVGLTAAGEPAVLVLTEGPGVAGLPRSLDGVPVVIQVTGRISALHHRDGHVGGGDEAATNPTPKSEWPRPVPIGVSTGHPTITAGTIGARVAKGVNVYALSNNHVYAATNTAIIGDNVLQPGTFDGGTNPDDAIGTLSEFVPIKFDGTDNVVDAAIALSSTLNLNKATPPDGYGTPRSATVPPRINMKVMKYGRTTGKTNGFISGINATVNVNYGPGQVARFVHQIIVQPGSFSAPGDSGSLIVATGGANDRKPVALLFAGSFLVTIGNPINAVLSSFSVAVDGS